LACGKAEHHHQKRVVDQSYSLSDDQDARKKEEGARILISSSRTHPQPPNFLQLGFIS
jgi:hypothetical protein